MTATENVDSQKWYKFLLDKNEMNVIIKKAKSCSSVSNIGRRNIDRICHRHLLIVTDRLCHQDVSPGSLSSISENLQRSNCSIKNSRPI